MDKTTLITAKEIAEVLSVPVSWVYERTRKNLIRHHRLGKYVRFNLAEVLEDTKSSEE